MYGDVEVFVEGRWTKSQSGAALSVINPATSEEDLYRRKSGT